jgi:predicted transposase YdaD
VTARFYPAGREKKAVEIAQNALAEGLSIETIQRITGLDAEKIKILSTEK